MTQLLYTSRYLAYLSRFSVDFLSQSRHLSIARWIDWEISCLLDSSSIHPRSIKLALLWTPGHLSIAAFFKVFKARQLSRYLSTPVLIPLDTSIYWDLLRFLCDSDFISSIFLDLSMAVHLPNALLSPLNLFLKNFSSLIKFFITWYAHFSLHSSCISSI